MSCCGSRRANWRSDASHLPARSAARPEAPAPAASEPRLRAIGSASLYLRGPASGRAYRFGAHEAVAVDATDLEALLRTGRLEQA